MRSSIIAFVTIVGGWALAGNAALAADSYAEDRAQIEDLMGRYLFAMDWRDAEAYASTFTEDGVLDWASGVEKGRDQIRAAVKTMRERDDQAAAKDKSGKWRPRQRHNITNTIIKIDGNKATSRSYWTAYTNANPERRAELSSYGHYEDELVKQNGKWLFTKRKIFNEEMKERTTPDKSPGW
jgi:uncharacterized protein (TIGR02246 family)